MRITVGTRGSKLDITQTRWIIEKIKKQYPLLEFEIKIIKTKEEVDQETYLDKLGDTEIITSAIEEELLEDKIDMAVHSMKDMLGSLSEGLCFAAIPRREDARDALILKEKYQCIEDLPKGARIGTGSIRRGCQIQVYREDLQIAPIRGDIDRRIRKLHEGNFDGIILAAADLRRLGLEEHISYCFPIDKMIPSPCQGILAIEVKEKNPLLLDIVSTIEDPISTIQYRAERAFMKTVNGGYQIPIGAYCMVEGTHLRLKGLLGDAQGKQLLVKELCGPIGTEEQVGIELACVLKKELGFI